MMPAELSELFFGFLKLMFVLGGILYLIFSVIVIRQIHTMQKSLMTSLSGKLKLLGYIHLAVAIVVLLYFHR